MKKLLLVCSVLLMVLACKSGEDSNIISIDSFSETSNADILTDFFDSLDILPLDFQDYFYDNMLLTYKESGDYFAIQDWNKSIRVFDKKGVIQTTISAIGRGPGEYRVIDDFNFSDEKQIKVLCNHEKIVSYSLSGEYLEEKYLDFPANNFAISNDSSFIFWVPRNSETQYGTDRVIIADKEGNVSDSFLPLFSHAVAYGSAMVPMKGENRILCRQYYDPNIYIIDNNKVIRTYHIDFKNKALTNKFVHCMSMDTAAEEMQTMQAYYISTAYEGEKVILMTIVYQDKTDSGKGAYWLINKETNDSKVCFYDIESDVFKLLGYPLYITEDNSAIFIAETEKYNNLKDKYPILSSNTQYCNTPYLLLKFHLKTN